MFPELDPLALAKEDTVDAEAPPVVPSVTLRDLARILGVNHSTISRALHNSPSISLPRRQEIQQAAQRLGYRPNAVATRLGHQRHAHNKVSISSEIAWINFWPDSKKLRSFKEFDLYWRGASERAEAMGYRIEEFIGGKGMTPSRMEKILTARNIHGILIPPHGGIQIPNGWETLDWSKFCTVRFGYTTPWPQTHLVTSNHLACGILAIEHMWRLGYKRLGFVATPHQHLYFQAGFLLKQIASVKGQAPICTVLTSENYESQLPAFSRWLKKNRPEAVLTDLPETKLMLEKLGYRVPGDIGLAATSVLDGNATAGIDQNSEEIGRAAFETLLSLLNHNQYGIPAVPREVIITGKWVDGPSLPQR